MLPDLRLRVPVGTGQGAGLPLVNPGQPDGSETTKISIYIRFLSLPNRSPE